MRWLKTIARELLGLFVDDGSFAVAIVAWLCASALALKYVLHHGPWSGPILFLGMIAILAESVMRRARQ
jgi:hypothetical protein